ncbi:MAG: extracellular solute-binding protein [Clostridia bacterium]|nr:extracellular solute-binding protein [Clostridia bacterium]
MKRIFASIMFVFMLFSITLSLSACSTENTAKADEIVIYNWADYIYDFEDDFKEYYKEVTGKNIKITYTTFDTNETMITKITKGDSKVDVICPSEYAIQKLMEMDYLVPLNYFSEDVSKYLDTSKLVGYEHYSQNLDNNIIEKIDAGFGNITCTKENGTSYSANMLDYMVPYMYGTLGILYNKEEFKRLGIFDKEIMNTANWGILFNDSGKRDKEGNIIPLSEELSGSILMKDSIRDSYAATLFYLMETGKLDNLTMEDGRQYTDLTASELINTVDDNIIELAKEALVEQKNELFGYEVDFGKDDLLIGNAMVDLAWSGDALYAVEESWNDDLNDGEGDYELGYYVPHTYGNIWFDGWVVPKTYNPKHETAVKLFINFLNTAEVSAANTLEIGYTSAVDNQVVLESEEARAILAEGYIVNAPEYLDQEVLDSFEGEYDFESWEEFEDYFFNSFGEMDDSNWRYPFEKIDDSENDYNRSINDLGMMRDFGDKNNDIVTMWNYARSVGVSALPIFAIVILVLGLAIAVIYLVYFISQKRAMSIKVSSLNKKE